MSEGDGRGILYLGISERPWSFTKELGRDDLNKVWQGLGMVSLLGAGRPLLLFWSGCR